MIISRDGRRGIFRDVLSLRVGDVVRLSSIKVGDPLTLSVGNEKKFYCQPGIVGKNGIFISCFAS